MPKCHILNKQGCNNYCDYNQNVSKKCCCIPGPKGDTGGIGPQGPTGSIGPTGPTGTVALSSYLTSRVTNSTIVSPGQSVTFGNNININGSSIYHDLNTSTFTLQGNQTYQIIFSINGINTSTLQGMIFALKINNLITDTRIITQNTNPNDLFSSGTAIGYVTVASGKTYTIQIVNLGLDTFDLVNGNISILQITNN